MYTIIGMDLANRKALLEDGTEVPITDVIGVQAVVAFPNGSFGTFDTSAETMTMQ